MYLQWLAMVALRHARALITSSSSSYICLYAIEKLAVEYLKCITLPQAPLQEQTASVRRQSKDLTGGAAPSTMYAIRRPRARSPAVYKSA
jgi:hypothetical protein